MNKEEHHRHRKAVIMKITLLQVVFSALVAGVSFASGLNAQDLLNRTISVKASHTELRIVLKQISQAADLRFSYDSKAIDANRLVDITASSEKVSQVLDRLLLPLNISYSVLEGRVVLRPVPARVTRAENLSQPDKTVSGRVTEENGEGLPGVNVQVKGTARGGVTDSNGRYELTVLEEDNVLVFSFVGYVAKEESIDNRTVIDTRLTPSASRLDEVIVIGYGTQNRSSLTNSVAQINGEELVRRPVSSIQQALQGQLSGLTILDRGGQPGSPNTQIIIRGANKPFAPAGLLPGANSQIGDNAPLVIVDGVEQPFQNINPDDIQSISILKDASSTAIYGSRATNGVILITTKRANDGKIAVSYSGFYAIQQAISKPEHMDIESYLHLQNTARENVGAAPAYSEAYIQEYVAGTISDPLSYPLPYDWYNIMLHTAPQVNHAIAVSGGSENLRTRFSLRSQEHEGVIANTKSTLTEVRMNTDFNVSDKVKFATDINYRHENNLEPDDITGIFRYMMQNAIWAVPEYPNGTYGGGTQGWNPLLLAEKGGTNRIKSDYIIGNIKGEWEIVKGLKLTSQLSLRSTNLYGKNFINTWETRDSTIVKRTNLINQLTESRVYNREINFNNLLNYAVSTSNQELKLLAGYSQIANDHSTLNASRRNFYNDDVQSIGQGANDATKDNGGGDHEWRLRSYFGRVNYAYQGKYLLEANARYDGSSMFAKANRYSFFPSFSAGWWLSHENFWRGLKEYVTDFKLRGSWGKTGNQAVAPYSYFSILNPVTYNFNNTVVQGYEQRQLADPNLIWETTTQTDVGADVEFFNGRVSFVLDYYKKKPTIFCCYYRSRQQ